MTTVLKNLKSDLVMTPLLEAALQSPHWKKHSKNGRTAPGGFDIQLLKHRKGRRLCLRIESPVRDQSNRCESYILKIWYNRRGARIYQQLMELNSELEHQARSELSIPRPLFYDKKAHALVYREIDGESVTKRLRRGNFKEIVTRIAAALADFHRLSPPSTMKPRTPMDEIESIEQNLEHEYGGEWDGVETVVRSLRKTVRKLPQKRMLIHRDLYDQQILQTGGGNLAIIDLDDAAEGDPSLDIGNFFAHLSLMKHWQRRPEKLERLKQKFINEWRKSINSEAQIKSRHVVWYEAVALARLACLQLKNGRTGQARTLIDKATEIMHNL